MHETSEAPAQAKRRRARDPRPQQALLTVAQASLETGVPTSSLHDLITRGHLPAVKLGDTRRLWVRRVDLAALIERSLSRAEVA